MLQDLPNFFWFDPFLGYKKYSQNILEDDYMVKKIT